MDKKRIIPRGQTLRVVTAMILKTALKCISRKCMLETNINNGKTENSWYGLPYNNEMAYFIDFA